MTKKITIWLLCLSILNIQFIHAEEKFLSLKKNKTNVRYGPGKIHAIKYIYRKVNLPVKQIDEKDWIKGGSPSPVSGSSRSQFEPRKSIRGVSTSGSLGAGEYMIYLILKRLFLYVLGM